MKSLFYFSPIVLTLILAACTVSPSPVNEPTPLSPNPEAATQTSPQATNTVEQDASPQPNGLPEIEVFEGVTPCSAQARALPQIPENTDCEQMIWAVTLYRDPATGEPTTYTLQSAYGVPQNNSLGLANGGTEIALEGNWAIVNGTKTNPEAEVYQLNLNEAETAVSFLKVSNDLLHVLGSDRSLLVGHGAWSYTLNRTDNPKPSLIPPTLGPQPEPAARPPKPPVPADSEIYEVFEGRTPCDALVLTFTQTPFFETCAKIKWQLTLYKDQHTGEPGTYLSMSTSAYREGTWTIVEGLKQDPDAVVYQLSVDGQQPLSFLKVDDHHLYILDGDMNFLVGNGQFSYTLSRTNIDNE